MPSFSSPSTTTKYPDQNNTNFITQINQKYEKYKITSEGEQAKKFAGKDGYLDLFSYQKMIEDYMDPKSPYRGILIYHGLGSGKTITAINVAERMGRKAVVLLPRSLRQNFIEEVIKFSPEFRRPANYQSLSNKEKSRIDSQLERAVMKKYSFVSSNSGSSAQALHSIVAEAESEADDKALGMFLKHVNSLDNKLLIIDEVHNLVSSMINADAKNGSKIYDMIMNAKNLRIVALSGSPVISDPFELAILFNMLRGFIYPQDAKKGIKFTAFPDYHDFHTYFIDKEANKMINKEIFQERIVGLVSFYSGILGDNRDLIPFKHKPIIKQVPMSDFQWKYYIKYRRQEQDEERKIRFSKKEFVKLVNKKPKRPSNTTFRVKSRQVSNFTFPEAIEKPMLRKKEKPGAFEAAVKKMLAELTKEDLTGKGLEKHSPKMKQMLEDIKKVDGNVLVYSQFISLEGVGVFSKVLDYNGFSNIENSKGAHKHFCTYGIFSGNTSDQARKKILEIFNSPENAEGKLIRIILVTAAASEGISLKNVRTVMIMEPYWHAMRIQQIIGRAARINSHADLPRTEREVNPIIYLATAPLDVNIEETLGEKQTTDQHILNRALRNQELLSQFLMAMKEMAFDCGINYTHNKSVIGECRICAPNNKPMYPPNIKDHLLPGVSNCVSTKMVATGLKDITIDGKEYKIDSEGNVYRKADGQENVYIIDPEMTKKLKAGEKIRNRSSSTRRKKRSK